MHTQHLDIMEVVKLDNEEAMEVAVEQGNAGSFSFLQMHLEEDVVVVVVGGGAGGAEIAIVDVKILMHSSKSSNMLILVLF